MPRRKVPLVLLAASARRNKAKRSGESKQPTNTAQHEEPTSQQATPARAQTPQSSEQTAKAHQPAARRKPELTTFGHSDTTRAVIPSGTAITIRLAHPIDSKAVKAGYSFNATVAHPVVSSGKLLVPESSPASGVVEAASAGKLRGEGRLSLRLTNITIQGVPYAISTAAISNAIQAKDKPSATTSGGGARGALIGGLAGGRRGAVAGALVGRRRAAARARATHNEEVSFPAESALTFRLQHPVILSGYLAA